MNELIIDDIDYLNIIEDIIYDEEFLKMKDYVHHGDNRYLHSLRVSYYSYVITKAMHLDYVAVARAALLHDFYINEDLTIVGGTKALVEHPEVALRNTKKYFDINPMQEDIIVHHMFPCTLKLPESKEAFLVSLVDKGVSTYEMIRFKAPLYASIYLLFLFELIKISR